MSTPAPRKIGRRDAVGVVTVVAAVIVPVLPRVHRGDIATALVSLALPIAVAMAVLRIVRPGPLTAGIGLLIAVWGEWLLFQVGVDAITCLVGLMVGLGVGLTAAPHADRVGPRLSISLTVAVIGVVYGAALTTWVGGNSTDAQWFGSVVSHGPRDRPLVALTFDDGPNATTTRALMDILDSYGVKATFFSVGKAVNTRPDISRALVDAGHLVGNHSYLHDEIRWLDPRYTELGRAQAVISDRLGVCPTFFRPPHGQHTPFMARVVRDHRMKMVTWDDSAGDWATGDPGLIARRILAKARSGSIIDLHDGLDGRVDADRTVLVKALPMILDGLAAKGLQPVRLDVLLGVPPYTGRC